jgi:carbamoyltransferase
VQTINEKQNKGLYELLIKFYKTTGCPMLLNTSLNIKGKPIVNSKQDGENFEKKYNIKVF